MSHTPNIANFEVIDLLGRGGMSTVWKARQVSLDRMVAIKVLAPKLATDPADVEQFHAEAKSAARLKHPGIVQVYDASISEGAYFFVMELVDGYTVGDWLRRKGRLSESEALVLLECIATALQYAWHDFGMIHCDIKPDNLMVDADGTVKITDLGLCRTISAMSSEQQDEVMGTPEYMSPEQALGDGKLDCRTDIYSAGAMLYHLVTGRPLFTSDDPNAVLTMQVRDTAPDPRTLYPSLTPSFCAMMARMLAKHPDERYPDWKALLEDLHRYKRKLPVRMPVMRGKCSIPMTARRLRSRSPFATRNLVGTVELHHRIGAWAFFAFLALVAVFWIRAHRSTGPGPEPMPPPRRLPGPAVPPAPLAEPDPGAPTVEEESENAALRQLHRVEAWTRAHPNDTQGAILRYQTLSDMYAGTRADRQAQARVAQLAAQIEPSATAVRADLERRSRILVEQGHHAVAIALLRDYAGPQAAETRDARHQMIREFLPATDPAVDRDESVAATLPAHLERTLRVVLAEGARAALAELDLHARDAFSAIATAPETVALRRLLDGCLQAEAGIPASFRAQLDGPPETVALADQPLTGIVRAVEPDHIMLETPDGTYHKIAYSDLSLRERISRIDDRDPAGRSLYLGLLAREHHAHTRAARHFRRLPAPFGSRLTALTAPVGGAAP